MQVLQTRHQAHLDVCSSWNRAMPHGAIADGDEDAAAADNEDVDVPLAERAAALAREVLDAVASADLQG